MSGAKSPIGFLYMRTLVVRLSRLSWFVPGLALALTACALAPEVNATVPKATATAASTTIPEWFEMELIDAQTGESFTVNDYAGKVVLVETMAIWCPNCIVQGNEVRKLHQALGNPEELISVSLDVDFNEDQASLKEYASGFGFDWHFAVAPLLVARALGNLYSAEYLNPPLSPMLIIDRDGSVVELEYGLKDAATLQKIVEPYLAK
jgi:cytochrome oxidase Cu insertion factor (SCO1/SenC/PrrC family)